MGFIGNLFHKLMEHYIERNSDAIIEAMTKVNEGGSYEDIDKIVNDYLWIILKIMKWRKPMSVVIDNEDYYTLWIDDKKYDLDERISHNDSRNTGRMMEIEVLYSKAFKSEIEERLNERIKNEW